MKTLSALLFATLVAVPGTSAMDIALKDGRTLRDARVLRHDAATITLRHEGGIAQVEKTKLPEALLTQYPYDQTEAAAQAERQAAALRQRQEQARRLREERAALAERAKQETPRPIDEPLVLEPVPARQPAYAPFMPGDADQWYFSMASRDRRHRWNRHDARPSPPAPAPDVTIHMTPDIGMTADVHMTTDLHSTTNLKPVAIDSTSRTVEDEECTRRGSGRNRRSDRF